MNNFDKLPKELKIETAQNLSTCDLKNFVLTSKYHLNLFQPLIDVRQLLHYVVCGEQEAVEAMLKKDMSLIFKRDNVTDCSGREFENISAFEYVLWALDKHMWAAMMACIPQNEEGRKVYAQLIAQYNKVNTEGVTYSLNGKTNIEQHFDFENTLIKEQKIYVDLTNAAAVTSDKQWREGVGGAQKLLPMHVVYEYCSNEPFDPVPQFISQPKSSKQFYNWITERNEHWFSLGSKLASDFAIYKGKAAGPWLVCRSSIWSRDATRRDLEAMTVLCKVRTDDFIVLKSLLEAQMTVDNQPKFIKYDRFSICR